MHKSVKLVASALAAVAVVGGSATAASAQSKPVRDKAATGESTNDPHDTQAKGHKPSGGKARGGVDKHRESVAGANVCGNNAGDVASAAKNGQTSIGNIFETGQTQQVICQVGEKNYAVTYNEGDVIDGPATVLAVGAVAQNLIPNVSVNRR
jgi:hypothetical protein